ncbi:MAG: hypothetical protein Q9218_003311 [Villophora microphyllina]
MGLPARTIDAICIDQENLAERTMQVSLMGDLYRKAKTVLVWLGFEDEFTADAFMTMERLASIPKDLYEVVKAQDFHDARMVTSKLGISPLSHRNWLGWVAFLHRPYLKRVWVVQEIGLADRVLCVCGSRRVPWESFADAVMFTMNQNEYGNNAPEYHKLLSVDIDPGFSACGLVKTKLFTTTFRPALPFRKLIEDHRETSASDPRDKIYAILDIYKTACPAPKSCGREFLGHISALIARAYLDQANPLPVQSSAEHLGSASPGRRILNLLAALPGRVIASHRVRHLNLKETPISTGNPDFDAWVKLIESEPIESAFGLDELSRAYAALMTESQQPDSKTQADYERSFAQVRSEMSVTLNCRRVFKTEGNLLGFGPDNMETGDEVWLLAGSRTLFVLRKVG